MKSEHELNRVLTETIVRDVFASVADAVVTIDEQHRVVFCNRVAEVMFGYAPEEMIGQDVSPLIPEPHFSEHRGYVERYIRTREERVIGKSRECFGRRKNGSSFPVEISYSVSKTAGQLYFTAVIRDISVRKEMEREMRFMEKLANVGKAVANVVHEIRKPLMLIGGFAQQLANCRALHADDMGRQKLRIIVEEVRRLETLLNGIRLLTRPPSSSEKRPVLLNELLNDTIELLDPMLQGREVVLHLDLAPKPLSLFGDPDQLKQVFLNLLQNAIEALDGRGRICITSRPVRSRVEIEIGDNGRGIPPEAADKIFDPFFTTKQEGTGLGLAITRNIIQDHGGDLTFDSEAGQGTRFLITLPVADRARKTEARHRARIGK